MKKFYQSSDLNNAPLSGAVEVNGLIYISGQIHADENWNLIGESIEDKFFVIMKRIENLLSEAELSIQDIIRVQIYIVDIDQLPALNAVYSKYFIHPMPVRTAISVKALPLGAELEIDVIATR